MKPLGDKEYEKALRKSSRVELDSIACSGWSSQRTEGLRHCL